MCTHCGKAFNQKVVLQTHMVRHTGEKPYMCSLCPASFSQKGNLHSHIQRVHSQVTAGPLSFISLFHTFIRNPYKTLCKSYTRVNLSVDRQKQ